MEKKYPSCPFCTSDAVAPILPDAIFHCNNCGENFDYTGEIAPQLDDDPPIHCPRCKSEHWTCWDERTFHCFDDQGRESGVRVVGYLRCNDCGESWSDVGTDCPPGTTCDQND